MTALRVGLYILSTIAFIVLFDVTLQWVIIQILVFDQIVFADTFKTIVALILVAVILYIFPKIIGAASKLIAEISPLKIFNFYFILSLAIINAAYGIYNTWFNFNQQYTGVVIVANLVATTIIIDFSYVLFKAHTKPLSK